MFEGPNNTPEVPASVRMLERVKSEEITSESDFWLTANDLAVDFNKPVSAVAEEILTHNDTVPEELKQPLERDRKELRLYEWAAEDLNDMPIEDEPEYRRLLEHVSQNRDISESFVRNVMLRHARLEPEIRTLIEAEGTDIPNAYKNFQ